METKYEADSNRRSPNHANEPDQWDSIEKGQIQIGSYLEKTINRETLEEYRLVISNKGKYENRGFPFQYEFETNMPCFHV